MIILAGLGHRVDYEALAVELLRSLRGRLSCAEFSRRAGYSSNVAQRWESCRSWPTMARFLSLHRQQRPSGPNWISAYFHGLPDWAKELDPCSPSAVAAFLSHVKGKTPISHLAQRAGFNRSTVSRWLSGASDPRLHEFLRLVDVAGRRLVDFVSVLADPTRLYSVRDRWKQLQMARAAAYELPWSHAVLRALEVQGAPCAVGAQRAWIARHLGISVKEVSEALDVLVGAGQVERTRRGFRRCASAVASVDTGADPASAHRVKLAWLETAVERMRSNRPGRFGYSLFSVTRKDLDRLHQVHMQYVRAMQAIIANSEPPECVGLYCSQLFDLGET